MTYRRSVAAASDELRRIASMMEQFEASESRAKTGTGSRREGEEFEDLVLDWWEAFAVSLVNLGAQRSEIVDPSRRRYSRLLVGRRSIYLPARRAKRRNNVVKIKESDNRASWFERVFPIRELVRAFPGEAEAVRRYAPEEGPFAKDRYPEMFDGTGPSFWRKTTPSRRRFFWSTRRPSRARAARSTGTPTSGSRFRSSNTWRWRRGSRGVRSSSSRTGRSTGTGTSST